MLSWQYQSSTINAAMFAVKDHLFRARFHTFNLHIFISCSMPTCLTYPDNLSRKHVPEWMPEAMRFVAILAIRLISLRVIARGPSLVWLISLPISHVSYSS
jgi:hypothetical protein